jgi:VIT1/CCC1 family predicted Fe2+/Mn2+ transporter
MTTKEKIYKFIFKIINIFLLGLLFFVCVILPIILVVVLFDKATALSITYGITYLVIVGISIISYKNGRF